MYSPIAGLPVFWCGFWPHKPFLPLSFPCQYTCGMGGGLADRGRRSTISYRYSGTEASMLPRLALVLRGFTQFCHQHFLTQTMQTLFSPPAESIHAKKHIVKSEEERQLTAADCSSSEGQGQPLPLPSRRGPHTYSKGIRAFHTPLSYRN